MVYYVAKMKDDAVSAVRLGSAEYKSQDGLINVDFHDVEAHKAASLIGLKIATPDLYPKEPETWFRNEHR